ncbi:MAG: tripartite tricarboxylate transporter substrate binding protein [Candidatus Paceibacterota bacterium]
MQPGTSVAETFPDRPIKLIIPAPPGASIDVAGRAYADILSSELKVTVVPENLPGALGQRGAQQCALSQPDGYTLCLLFYGAMVSAPLDREALGEKPLYDSATAFAAVARATGHGFVLVARKEAGSTLEELRDYAKSRDKLNVGFAFPNAKIATRLLTTIIPNVKQGVPSTSGGGEGEIMANLLSGVLEAAFVNITTIRGHLNDDRLRVVGVLGVNRSPFLPSVPSLNEQPGGTVFGTIGTWGGFVVPAGTPADRIKILSAATQKAAEDPKLQAKLKALWVAPSPAPADIFAEQIRQEIGMYKKGLRASAAK